MLKYKTEKLSLWLRGFFPAPILVNQVERLRSCIGALLGIGITGLVSFFIYGPAPELPLLIAPMGASAVLLFGVPASPLAQPWSILGGNAISAIIGVSCALWIPSQILSAAVAVGASIGAMFALRCLHPPSGAVALTAVLGGPIIHAQGYHFVISPVGSNSLLLLLVALIFNNATKHPYPHPAHTNSRNTHHTEDAPPMDRLGFTHDDLRDVIKQYNQVLDVNEDDLEMLFMQAEMHAYRRRFGEITCGDIMSRDMVAIKFDTTSEDAWQLLSRHQIKALPVIDATGHIIGIVTQSDFLKHSAAAFTQNIEHHSDFHKFVAYIQRSHKEDKNIVGNIMTVPARTMNANMHIVELVPLMSDYGLHHVPIIDDDNKLVGIITQSDLISALYRGKVMDSMIDGIDTNI